MFWMSVGAAAGVAGYRRASQLAQAISPRRGRRRGRPGDHGGYRGIADFLGDVRDGMELYVNRRSGPGGPTLDGQQVLAEGAGQAAAARRGHPGTDYAKDGR